MSSVKSSAVPGWETGMNGGSGSSRKQRPMACTDLQACDGTTSSKVTELGPLRVSSPLSLMGSVILETVPKLQVFYHLVDGTSQVQAWASSHAEQEDLRPEPRA